jgi:hypothetical protein
MTENERVGEGNRADFLLQQYVKLREEIQYRTGIQQQLVTVSLLGAGATLTVGANNSVTFGIPVLLLYPPLVTFLAIAWSTQYATIRAMGHFIAHLERGVFLGNDANSLGWESMLWTTPGGYSRPRSLLSGWQDAKGIFLGIQVLALALAVARSGIHIQAFHTFFGHPEAIRPFLWMLLLGLVDLTSVAVTLSLPESHPAMRRTILQEAMSDEERSHGAHMKSRAGLQPRSHP